MLSKAESITMKLSGVHDTATRRAAGRVLREMEGVRSVSVRQDTAHVAFYPEQTTVSQLTDALTAAGFPIV